MYDFDLLYIINNQSSSKIVFKIIMRFYIAFIKNMTWVSLK